MRSATTSRWYFRSAPLLFLGVFALIPGSSAATEQAGRSDDGVNTFYGGYQEHIPLEVPRFHGIEPRLSLDYNSSGGNG